MSRRARRQQEELADLSSSANVAAPTSATGSSDSSNDDDDAAPAADVQPKTGGMSAFAALSQGAGDDADGNDAGEEQDDDEEGDADSLEAQQMAQKKNKSKKKKKKKAKAAVATDNVDDGAGDAADGATPGSVASPTQPAGSQTTPAKKKKKAKAKAGQQPDKQDNAAHNEQDDGLDEIDRALQQLGQAGWSSAGSSAPSTAPVSTAPTVTSRIRSLLAVETKHLDAEAELKRFFGAKVVSSAAAKPQLRGARAQNPHHALNRQFSKGGMLARPAQHWPAAAFAKSGLDMELVESGHGESLWTFEHSPAYKEVTQMYLQAVASMDPNQLMAILHVHPYHIETLIGLSDMANLQGDPGMSSDFLDRALYAFERSFAPNFRIDNGNVRLDFNRIESRGLFRAIEKRTSSLMRRGTWRTLFEHTKLLYALSPFDDPYGALLYLDFTAPKARQYSWFIDLVDELPSTLARSLEGSHLQLDSYPGLYYAKALSRWHLEDAAKQDHEQSTKELQSAILRYPLALVLLVKKLDRSPPKEIVALSHAQAESGYSTKPSYILQLLSHLYVHRSDTLWKEPEVLDWLLATARSTAPLFASAPLHPDIRFGEQLWAQSLYPKNGVPEGILRHVLVSDIQNLRLFLPQSVLNGLQNTYDPLPPGPGFDDAYFRAMYDAGAGSRPGGRGASSRSGAATGTLAGEATDSQGLVNRLMQYLQAGGGAGEGGRMDADTEAAVIAQLEQFAAAGRGGGVPGQLPGADGSDDEAAGDEAQTAGGMLDFFRTLWGGQHGAQQAAAVDNVDSDEEEELDDGEEQEAENR